MHAALRHAVDIALAIGNDVVLVHTTETDLNKDIRFLLIL